MKVKIIIIILTVVSIFAMFSTTASAAQGIIDCPICGGEHIRRFSSGLGEMAYDRACTVYGGTTDGIGKLMEQFAKFDVTENSGGVDFATVWNVAGMAYRAIAIFGSIVALIAFSMAIFDEIRSDNLNGERFSMLFIKLAVSIIIIQYGFEILTVLLQLSGEIFSRITEAREGITQGISADKCNYEAMTGAAWYEALGEWISLLPAWLVVKATDIVATVISLVRISELMIMTMFAPLGMGDIGFKDVNGNAWRYLKKYFAVCLQGAVIIALYLIYTLLTQGMGAGWVTCSIYRVVLILAIIKSQAVANDIAGV